MRVIVHDYEVITLDIEIEAALGSSKSLETLADFFFCTAVEQADGCCSHGIVDIDRGRNAELKILDQSILTFEIWYFPTCRVLDGKVEENRAVADADVGSIEIRFLCAAVFCIAGTCLQLRAIDLDTFVLEQKTVRTDQRDIMRKRLTVSLFCSIDVEVVRITACYDAHVWLQGMERAVELIGLYDGEVTLLRQHEVALVWLEDSAKESVAIYRALLEDVGNHAARRGLAVCAGNAETALLLGDKTKDLAALHDLEPILLEIAELAMILRDGRRVADDTLRRVLELRCNSVDVVLEMDVDSFIDQGLGQWRWCLVIAAHLIAIGLEVSFER